jgi:hypothetical protein
MRCGTGVEDGQLFDGRETIIDVMSRNLAGRSTSWRSIASAEVMGWSKERLARRVEQ